MVTSTVNINTTDYVRVNVGYRAMLLQAHRDQVRIVMSDVKPTRGNTAFHTLSGGDDKLSVGHLDTNVWALAMTDTSRLTSTEFASSKSDEFYFEISRGNVKGHRIVHKFGQALLGTDVVPITASLTFQTPMTPQLIEVLSTSASDATGGVGGTKVRIEAIGADYTEVTIDVDMNGLTPVPVLTPVLRLNRMYVIESGSYATATQPSHVGAISARTVGTTDVWGVMSVDPIPFGQSEIGAYTIPIGHKAYLLRKDIYAETGKSVKMYFFQRPNIDDITPPYSGVFRLVQREIGIVGSASSEHPAGRGPFVGPCDVGFMGHVTVTAAEVSVEFEMVLIQDGY